MSKERIISNFAVDMKQYRAKLAGILGTIIIHLIGAIIFMSMKLTAMYKETGAEFLVEFQSEEEFIEEEIIEAPKTIMELFENDDRYRDIVKNIANQEVAEIDPEKYQDKVKEELIAKGLLSKDNYIDEQKNKASEFDDGDTALEAKVEEENDKIEVDKSANEMAAMYKGKTRVFYFLENRHHLNLPIPIYKCENSGTIVVDIVVEQNGRVSNYSLNELESSTSDDCLYESAVSSIKRTSFNPDTSAPAKQSGKITYHFVEQ